MARALYRDEPAFQRVVDEGLSYLSPHVAQEIRDIWLPASGVTGEGAAERFLRPSLQLPAILIVEVALARLWISWGVKPAALIGHSMGENAAACIAGVLSFERAVNLVRLRGELFEEIPPGGMLSVALTPDDLKARLPADLDVASINAPELCVVSGSNEALEAFRQSLVKDGIEASRIPIDIAAHSRMLAPILERFEAFLRATPLSAPNIPIVSNLTGTWLSAAEARDASYWTKHLRSTVRFGDGMTLLASNPSRIYVEVGPGRVLGSLAKAQGIPANQVINSLPHADETIDDNLHVLTSLGRAWATGLAVPLERLWASAAPRRVNLPTYAFQHQSYFLDRVVAAGTAEDEASPVKIADMAGWGWQPVWKQSAANVVLEAETEPTSWLVFLDDGGLGKKLVSLLRGSGHSVATVALGDAFGVAGEGEYVLCPEHGREDYDALLAHLASNSGIPQRIVHLWLATTDESFRPGSSFFHRNEERGFYSLFFLGQALSDAGNTAPLQITVVTNGMLRVGDEPLPYPEKATVLGPAQVLPREMPNVSVRVIDIPRGETGAASFVRRQRDLLVKSLLSLQADGDESHTIVDRIRDDVLAENASEIVAYRKGRRWTQSYGALALDKTLEGEEVFRERGVYLITGGLGELATACAEDLARRFKARLVLVGRTALPDRSEWQDYLAAYGEADRIGRAIAAIRKIEAAGGEVRIARADITNSEAMQTVVAETKAEWGAINGVLHTAGVVKDDLIALKAVSDIEDVFAPKILGTLVLAEVLDREALDVLVLFSSTSTDTAPAGQVDYVAANAFLNAFAESRVGSPTKTIAVHWGVWKDVGLAARAIARAERDDVPASVEAAHTPLFDRRVATSSGKEDWLEARLDSSRHWVLNEHRLKTGQAIWPGTGYIELVAEALAEYRIDGPFEIEDLTFLRPLHVPDDEPRTVRVGLRADGGVYQFSVDSEQGPGGSAGPQRHAEAQVKVLRAKPAAFDIESVLKACSERSLAAQDRALRSAQHDNLRFGPRWQVLRSVGFGRGEAVAKLALGDDFATDIDHGFLVHPALLDIATGYAMELIDGYSAAAGLWVPMTYGRIRVHGALPASVWSHVRLNTSKDLGPGYATFDVTIADEAGRVVLEVEGFTIKQLAAGVDLAASLNSDNDAKAAHGAKAQSDAELSPALARLAAQVDQGILPEEGFEALVRAIGSGKPQVIVSSMDLGALKRAASRADVQQAASATFERPDLGVDFVEPGTEIEKALAGFWTELLGVKKIGTQDSFFDLGGHSLIAVRLFRMIKTAFAVDFPISVLFEAPTIAQCAALIEKSGAKLPGGADEVAGATVTALDQPRHLHLVRMDSGKDPRRTPFFLCAGMFGNILNLRHLAVQIGADRPVYGLQARGIYGGQAPHETFEDMARDYLAEIRSVQPHGPYLIGGFSGGGLVAYEMAQQLRAAGEETALVVLLDTPYPEVAVLSIQDRIMMKLQDFQREGLSYFGSWIRKRIAWELHLRAKANNQAPAKSAEQFHNEEIEGAFRRALGRYQGLDYVGSVLLLRPKLVGWYRVTGNRVLNIERSLLRDDNGWRRFVARLHIHEVPGDHDSMVLEPSVRVLAGRLREELTRAESSRSVRQIAAE
jgi:acyl transferase domain-containing protein